MERGSHFVSQEGQASEYVRLYNSYYDNQNKIVQSKSLFGVASKLTVMSPARVLPAQPDVGPNQISQDILSLKAPTFKSDLV